MKRYKTFEFEKIVIVLQINKSDKRNFIETTDGSFAPSSFYSKPKVGEVYKQGMDIHGFALKYDSKLNRKRKL